jgi:hypothetical protein
MGPRLREDDVLVDNASQTSFHPQHPQPKNIHLVQRPAPASAVCIHRIRLQVSHIVKVIDAHRVRPRLEQDRGERGVHLFTELTQKTVIPAQAGTYSTFELR